jgi:hypothetical protein
MKTRLTKALDAVKAMLDWLKAGLAGGQPAMTPVPVQVKASDNGAGDPCKRQVNRDLEAGRAIRNFRRTGSNTGFSTGRSTRRNTRGSAMSEFGPALFFLFIFAVFPVLDIIALCFGYISCVTMNDLQLREAAKLPKSLATAQAGPVQQTIPQQYMNTVMGAFSGLTALPATNVSYSVGTTTIYVTVDTTVTVRPFLTIPFFVKVPGLGEPASFTISNSRILENPRFAIE